MGEGEYLSVRTRSEAQTIGLGRELGRLLHSGAVVALRGDLGSGKTRFVQGMAQGLGVPPSEQVSSPSFALIHEYLGGRLPLYHVDLYRLPQGSFDPELGLEEYIHGQGVCAIEWAERVLPWLPEERLDVELLVCGARTRDIHMRALGATHGRILDALEVRLGRERARSVK